MKKIFIIIAVSLAFSVVQSQVINTTSEYVPNEVIIKIKDEFVGNIKKTSKGYEINVPAIEKINNKYVYTNIKKVFEDVLPTKKGAELLANVFVVRFYEVVDMASIIKEYYKTGCIVYAEPNYIDKVDEVKDIQLTPNDTYYSRQWHLNNVGSYTSPFAFASKAGADIDAQRAWGITTGSSSIIVGVLDSGVKYDHPDFSGRIWNNPGEINNNNLDDDGNGKIDDYYGWDFYNNDKDPADDYGHGTNVASIIGAKSNNSLGLAGVDWNCKILVCKTTDNKGSGTHVAMANAITYCVSKGVKIINCSFGGSNSVTKENACNYAYTNGSLVVSSMGNTGIEEVQYPAGYANVLAVGATNAEDKWCNIFLEGTTGGSTYGNHIDVCAPGTYIFGFDNTSNTNYGTCKFGTSQSTAIVSGICALVLARNPSLTPAQLTNVITSTAEDKVGRSTEDVTGFDKYHGWGRVNAYNAVTNVPSFIPESNTETSWLVFPNPTNNIIMIKSNEELDKPTTLVISDIFGKEYYTNSIETNIVNINVSEFPAGIYIIRIVNEEMNVTQKIIKN